jgi:putative transposase
MARNPRVIVPGYAYHLTQRGTNRQEVFHSAGDRRVYLTLMRENLEEAGIRLLAFCLMTNHVHFMVVPERMDSMSVWMRRVNGRYAQYYNARMNRTGHLWQARFFSCAMSWRHRAIGLRYVEMNRSGRIWWPDRKSMPSPAPPHTCRKCCRPGRCWTGPSGRNAAGRRAGRTCWG